MTKSILPTTAIHSATPHTTANLTRRALLLISFLLLSLGNVWGAEKPLWSGAQKSVTIFSDDIPDAFSIVEGIVLRVYGDDLASSRFYIVTVDKSPFLESGSDYDFFNGTKETYYESTKDCWKFELSLDESKVLKSKGLMVESQWNGTNVTKITYEIIDNFVGSLKPGTDGKQNAISDSKTIEVGALSTTISLSDAFDKLKDLASSNPTYVRISLEYKGEAISPSSMLSFSGGQTPQNLGDEHGYYIYKSEGLEKSDLPNVMLNLSVAELEDYQIVTVWSTDISESLPDKEPDWDLQYTFAFEYPFKGDVTSATQMESTFKIAPSLQSNEMALSFDYGNQKIELKNTSNEVIATAPIDLKFLNVYSNASEQLTNNFYIRWFLQKSGGEIYKEGALTDATNDIYRKPAKERYYYYWDAEKDDTPRNLDDILKINLNGSILDPLKDYELVFTIATKKEGIIYDDEERLTHEPDEMAYQYTFRFEDRPFEAENLSTVKTIDKMIMYDESTGIIEFDFFNNYNEVIINNLATDENNFVKNGYLRWYITYTDESLVPMDLWDFEADMWKDAWNNGYHGTEHYGYYRDGFESWRVNQSKINPTITLHNKDAYKDYQIVCVITTDQTGMSLPDCEPANMQVKYVFQLVTEDDLEELQKFSFVHYKGYSGRDWITPKESTGRMLQQVWNETVGEAEEQDVDIRQSVHTWEYDIYVKPTDTDVRTLTLPFQYYSDKGQDSEPRGYIRWYDWNTDKRVESTTFKFEKTSNSVLIDDERGWFGFCIEDYLTHKNVGVTFTPTNNFNKTIDIACDVSKYSDGITVMDGAKIFFHEPTLSNRYIFHIHPASEIADSLAFDKDALETAEDSGSTEALYEAMLNLEEDKGKVVVSLGEKYLYKENEEDEGVITYKGKFALRFDMHDLSCYIMRGESESEFLLAEKIQWYAYFEHNNNILRKSLEGEQLGERPTIITFDYKKFQDTYKSLDGTSDEPIMDGKKFHVVGYVGSGTFDVEKRTGNYAPVVHYELHFLEAPPLSLDNLPAERTDLYMETHYVQAGIVDFDGNPETNPNVVGNEAQYYSTPHWYDPPTSSADNSTYEPFPWDDIQYGFCYPELTQTIRNGFTDILKQYYVTPQHGDYIILKSVNVSGISTSDSRPYGYKMYQTGTELYDYTYYTTKSKEDVPIQYGSFLYTDASDESRSIATIPFTADLCKGSSIYFTAVVADMTSESIHPQLLIRIVGIDKDGNRQRIVAFHTGDISTEGANATVTWYQIYGESTLPTNFDINITKFEAEVINYAGGTLGADFAIDHIVIYTSNAKVLLTQTPSSDCGPESITNNKVQIYMEAEGLQNEFGVTEKAQPIYWRIYEQVKGGDDILIKGVEMYPQYGSDGILISDDSDEDKRNTYGITYVVTDYNAEGVIVTESPNTLATFGWYKDEEGNYFFQIANKTFETLIKGREYYVSVHAPCTEVDFPNEQDESFWGKEKIKCSIYSDFFIPRRQYVTYIVDAESGTEGGELSIPCGSDGVEVKGVKMVLKVPDPNDKITGFSTYPMTFDYAFCPMEIWDNASVNLDDSEYTYNDLAQAWQDYREKCPKYVKDEDHPNQLDPSYNPSEPKYKVVLEYAIDKGILLLANSEEFEYTFTKNETNQYHVLCLPVERTIKTSDGTTKTVCDAFEVIFTVKSSGGPSLTLGFDDVDYTGKGIRVVRVGLEQIRNMQEKGYLLHIPVNMFKEDVNGKENEGAVVVVGDYLELLPNGNPNLTTAPNVGNNKQVAKFEGDNEGKLTINSDRMYISLNFHDAGVTPQTFYEGFTYHMFFQVKAEGAGDDACEAPVNFLLKVVPEFVTWNGSSSQWNDDSNWSRSTRAELYKSADNTQNTKTEAHPEGYKDNNDLNEITAEVGHPAFVPMKFTYVTVPSDNVAPNLVNLTMGEEKNKDYGIYTNIGNDATPNIQYDLMVRYTEKTCIDHGITGIPVYDCEKFYGNWAKEIYFKPRAELVYQHYLTYEKAWVEKELTAGKWTLMSTPLQNTYAGDMYVPAIAIPDYSLATPEDVTGMQVTEAFQPIKFTDQITKNGAKVNLYSRTKYPIYQRSWLQEGSRVYIKTNDVRKTDYSANLVGSVDENFALWSHTYNDVTVDYSEWKGFAIRAHKSDYSGMPTPSKALLRLPKKDLEYDYYKWDGNMPTDDDGKVTPTSLTKTNYGKLFTDGNRTVTKDDGIVLTYGVEYFDANGDKQGVHNKADDGSVNELISELQNVDGYLLVGNPYLCSIDMTEFFIKNTILTGDSWIYDDNELEINPEEIKPLQSFFVKLANTDKTNANITFTSGMMKGNETSTTQPAPALTMTANNGHGQSTATVSVGEEARSVETLFDSNLEDVPVVYTVADGQAVSIHQLTELNKPIAFGVTCSASDELVEVTFSDVAQLTHGDVYVVDAVTGEQTAVDEGSTLSLQPNDYGRYYLLAGTTDITDKVDMQKGILVSVRGKEVTVSSGEELTQVHALSLTGAAVYQDAARSTTTSFTLPSGVYIIQAKNAAGEQQTTKIMVR